MTTQPNVKSFAIKDANGEPLRLSVSTDIVDYMDSARTFGREDLADAAAHGRFQRRLIALPDPAGGVVTPMVLSVGNNNSLHLVRKVDGTAADGWQRIDLAPALEKVLGKRAFVRAVDAAWTDDDRMAIAVSIDGGAPDEPSRILVAYDLSSQTDWNTIAFTDCGTRGSVRVSGIRILDEGNGRWTVVLNGSGSRVDTLYLLWSGLQRPFAQAAVFSPAVDYQEVFDFDVLVDPFVGGGMVVLGQSGGTRVLSFRPFPKYDAAGSLTSQPPAVPLPCPGGANAVATSATRNGGNDLYIGGQGVHVIVANEFENQDDARVTEVIAPDAAPNVHQLAVGDAADGSVAVFGLLQSAHLLVAKRGAGESARWSTPLRVRQHVQLIAPVHGDQHARTSLLAIYTDGTAAFLLQDASMDIWRESPLLVANPNQVSAVSCYGTNLRILADGGLPKASTKVKVSASVLTSVLVNNKSVFIGPDVEIETEADQNGSVHLYDRARSLTPSVYRFRLDGVDQTLDVNPAAGAHAQLREATADQLRNAMVRTADGETSPLLPEEFCSGARRNEVDGMASALNRVASLAADTTSGPVQGVTQTQMAAPFSSTLKPDTLPQNYQLALVADGNGVRPAPAASVQRALTAGNSVDRFFSDLGDSIADFFEGLWGRIQEGWLFIVRKVEDAIEFICAIGDKIKRWVLNTLEQIGSFFTWLWEQVRTGLEKVWNFLKFVFDWDDILIARDVMVNATDEALRYLKSSTGVLKEKVAEGLDYAIGEVIKWKADVGVAPAQLPSPAPGTSFSSTFSQVPADVMNIVDRATGNSVIGWVSERMNGLFDEVVHIEGPNPATLGVDAAISFVTNLADDQYRNLSATWEQLQADMLKLFNGKMPAMSDLSFGTLRNLFVAVGGDVVVGFLRVIRDLALRAIDLLASMIDVARAMLFARISFPFIEKLVELVTPGTNLDTSFRLIDAIMLLVSIPSTITYKLIFGTSPFAKGQPVNLPFGRVMVQTGGSGYVGQYLSLAAAFFKTGVAVYSHVSALKSDFSSGPVATWLSALFAAVGVGAMLWTRLQTNEGSTVEALEWAAIGVAGLSALVALVTAAVRARNPVVEVIHNSHKFNAGVDIFSTAVQVATGAAVFGVIIDRLARSNIHYDRVRQLPESCKWIALILDQAGTILADAAIIVPLSAAKVKVGLIACSMATKGGALMYQIIEVSAVRDLLWPLGPRPSA